MGLRNTALANTWGLRRNASPSLPIRPTRSARTACGSRRTPARCRHATIMPQGVRNTDSEGFDESDAFDQCSLRAKSHGSEVRDISRKSPRRSRNDATVYLCMATPKGSGRRRARIRLPTPVPTGIDDQSEESASQDFTAGWCRSWGTEALLSTGVFLAPKDASQHTKRMLIQKNKTLNEIMLAAKPMMWV